MEGMKCRDPEIPEAGPRTQLSLITGFSNARFRMAQTPARAGGREEKDAFVMPRRKTSELARRRGRLVRRLKVMPA